MNRIDFWIWVNFQVQTKSHNLAYQSQHRTTTNNLFQGHSVKKLHKRSQIQGIVTLITLIVEKFAEK